MREAPARLLYAAHPGLYAMRGAPPDESALADHGIEHQDGWFALTAALSETIVARATGARVLQCKAEFSSYRLRLVRGDLFCAGALRVVETVALRVSEPSGRRGCPTVRRPAFTRVQADQEAIGWRHIPGLPPPPVSTGDLLWRHASILADARITLPEACLDLVDGWLDGVPASMRLIRLGIEGDVEAAAGGDDDIAGALALLARLGRRVDRATGAIGPVDGAGALIESDQVRI